MLSCLGSLRWSLSVLGCLHIYPIKTVGGILWVSFTLDSTGIWLPSMIAVKTLKLPVDIVIGRN